MTGQVIGAALTVHSKLGPGLLESAYRARLAHELRRRGVQVRSEVELPVYRESLHVAAQGVAATSWEISIMGTAARGEDLTPAAVSIFSSAVLRAFRALRASEVKTLFKTFFRHGGTEARSKPSPSPKAVRRGLGGLCVPCETQAAH